MKMSIRSENISPEPIPHIKLGTSINEEIMDPQKLCARLHGEMIRKHLCLNLGSGWENPLL